jgi:hypothetical protein
MLPVIVVVVPLPLVLDIRGYRRARRGNRWPYAASCGLMTLLVVVTLGGGLVSLLAGRARWNGWVDGTPQREDLTLTALFVGAPLLVVLGVALLLVGALRDRRARTLAARG